MDLTDFGSLQLRVLAMLWERSPASAGDLCETWPTAPAPAYTTVLSALQKLYRRKVVRRRKQGRAHVYTPRIDRVTFQQRYLAEIRARAFGGSALGIVAALFNGEEISEEEFQRIRELVKRHGRK